MSHDTFLYVTYIATTPEKVWQALLEGDLTRQYWANHELKAADGWHAGARWQLSDRDDSAAIHHEGKIFDHQPGHSLTLTWANPEDAADASKQTRVTFTVEAVTTMVRLTVTHERLYPEMAARISTGWPYVLASLKSFLETGHGLPIFR